MLGIDKVLGAKTAADIGCHKAHCGGRDTEGASGIVAGVVDALRRDMSRVAGRLGVPRSDDAARLHRIGDDAMIVEPQPYDMGGGGKGVIDRRLVAGSPIEAEIAWRFVGDLRCTGSTGGFGGGHRRERHIIDRDQFGGIKRLFAGLARQ